MTEYINEETTNDINSPLNFEKFGSRLKTENEYFIFPNPNIDLIDKYLFYLLKNSEKVKLKEKYKYRPDYLSYDYYGTTILSELILYVNNVFSIDEFDINEVLIPSIDSIKLLLGELYDNDDTDLMTVQW